MLLTFRDLSKLKVFTEDEPNVSCAKVLDCVIDREKGTIEAFWVLAQKEVRFLPKNEILYWKDKSFFIKDVQNLLTRPVEKRLQYVVENERRIYKAPVFDKDVQMGRVHNFSFDTISPRIVYLYVVHGWWIFRRHFIVHASRIEKIDAQGIHILNKPIKGAIEELDKMDSDNVLAEVSPYSSISRTKK